MTHLTFLTDFPAWLTFGNFIITVGLLLSAGNAYIILKSRQREEAHQQTIRLSATYKESWEKAEKELAAEKVLRLAAEEERDTFRTGYTAVGGIIIKEVLNFAQLQRERDALERECESLHGRLASKRIEAHDKP